MKIAYIARHFQRQSNDDEGSIAYALEKLGHSVIRIPERIDCPSGQNAVQCADLVLFHHWANAWEYLPQIKCPKVFWYFDRVRWNDPGLELRNRMRETWMQRTLPLVDLAFCTDGDWVAKHPNSNLIQLSQGADERVVGRGISNCGELPSILFAGSVKGVGQPRVEFKEFLQTHWGKVDEDTGLFQFNHIEKGIYGRSLADRIAANRIVVAPHTPVTDRYWSNRVYITLGFGGFLLHPYTAGLKEEFRNGYDLVMYHDLHDLKDLIDYYLTDSGMTKVVKSIQLSGLETVKSKYLYRHRCQRLIQTVQERLGVK